MPNRTSGQINAEIYNIGPALFKAVRHAVMTEATHAATRAETNANRVKLGSAVDNVLAEAIPNDIDHRGLWQVLWARVVYAGTRAAKATSEIESMRKLVPLFQDLDNYQPGRYVFDEEEWVSFATKWKDQLKSPGRKTAWIKLSKTDPSWNPAAHFARAKTTPEVWKVLTKDDAAYPNLKFSTKTDKIKRYLAVAEFLHQHRANGNSRPLDFYTEGSPLSPHHLTGEAWVSERKILQEVRRRFERQVGALTALHTMMDLGLKTIKPDRVMAYLFCQLGWLQTLPETLNKESVMNAYTREEVIREMTGRADVLAASLDRAGFRQAHRLLDIWFVKYGQEAEPAFGITVNLQSRGDGIRKILQGLSSDLAATGAITDHEARAMWPMEEFQRATGRTAELAAKLKRGIRSKKCMTRREAEDLFMKEWRRGHSARPDIYPAGRPGIANAPKEEIISKIELGIEPEDAFLSVLVGDEDD
jgi:hypothetical protein